MAASTGLHHRSKCIERYADLGKAAGALSVPVQLSDADVEEVLRETVLKESATASKPLTDLFSSGGCLGGISAHLQGSSFCASA